METKHDALLGRKEIKIGEVTIPVITGRMMMLLEKINSPWLGSKLRDPATGEPIPVDVTPSDMMRALYIMNHAQDPRLPALLDDDAGFFNTVLHWSDCVAMADINQIGEALKMQLGHVGDAAENDDLPQSTEGKATPGPMAT